MFDIKKNNKRRKQKPTNKIGNQAVDQKPIESYL